MDVIFARGAIAVIESTIGSDEGATLITSMVLSGKMRFNIVNGILIVAVYIKRKLVSLPRRMCFNIVNGILMLLSGASFAAWLFFFTDWWSIVYAVGGGIVTVCTAVYGCLPRERKKALRTWIENQLSQPSRRFRTLVIVLNSVLLLALIATFLAGTLVIGSQQAPELQVQLLSAGNVADTRVVKPNESFRRVLWASWWASCLHLQSVTVRAAGYPDRCPVIRPWRRAKLVAPGDFLNSPLALVIPDGFLVAGSNDACKRLRYKVEVAVQRSDTADWKSAPKFSFDGHVFWIGCKGSVRILPKTFARFSENEVAIASQSSDPLCQVEVPLNQRDRLRVRVFNSDGETVRFTEEEIQAPASLDDFPVLVRLQPGGGE